MKKPSGVDEKLTTIMQAGSNLGIMDAQPSHLIDLICNPEQQARNFILTPEKIRTGIYPRNSQKLYAPAQPDILVTRNRERTLNKLLGTDEYKALAKSIAAFKKEFKGWADYIDLVQVGRDSKSFNARLNDAHFA